MAKTKAERRREQRAERRAAPAGGGRRNRRQGNKRGLPGLNKQQNQAIQQRQTADIALGDYANEMLPGIQESFSQPFDWGGLPSAPVSGDFNEWRQGQIDSTYADFENRMQPRFQQELEDFEQMAYERGWAPGSDNYTREKSRLEQSHNDARQSALTQAQSVAGQNAGQFFNIGTQARGNALSEALQGRYMPMNEFNMLYGARSPFDLQNLTFSQQGQLQKQGEQHAKWMMQNQPRGGGGGGGSQYAWQQYGFSSPQEYDAYQDARQQANTLWNYQNNPQYQQQSGPSYGAQLGGQALGVGLGLLGSYGMSLI